MEISGAVGVGAATATWFYASHTVVFRRQRHCRRQHWATGAEVLDGGAQRQQESKISWVPAALRIAMRAVKPLPTHGSYKRSPPSRTTLAQDGTALESKGSEPAGREVHCCLSPPYLNLPSTPVKGEVGMQGGVATARPQPARVRHLPLEGGRRWRSDPDDHPAAPSAW